MRRISRHWEGVLTGALFLGCVYGTVFYIRAGAFAAAMYAVLLAVGYFVTLMVFVGTARARRFMRMDDGAERGEG